MDLCRKIQNAVLWGKKKQFQFELANEIFFSSVWNDCFLFFFVLLVVFFLFEFCSFLCTVKKQLGVWTCSFLLFLLFSSHRARDIFSLSPGPLVFQFREGYPRVFRNMFSCPFSLEPERQAEGLRGRPPPFPSSSCTTRPLGPPRVVHLSPSILR